VANGRWRAFGDFERQSIFKTFYSVSLADFRATKSGNATHRRLNVNCRNLPRIARQVEQLGRLSPTYRTILRPDDGVDPSFKLHRSAQEADSHLRELLLHFETAGFSRRDIVVLSPTKECSAARLRQNDGHASVLAPYPSTGERVQFCTIQAFKGLEAPVVILTDFTDITSESASDLFYIGLSRSTQKLTVCASVAVATQLFMILQSKKTS